MSEYSSYDHFNSEVSDKIKNLAKMAESSTTIAPAYYNNSTSSAVCATKRASAFVRDLPKFRKFTVTRPTTTAIKSLARANCITGVSKSRILSAALQAKGVSALKKSRTFCCSANFPTRMNSNRSSAF